MAADSDPIRPARVYGELRQVLAPDAITIGDGGDFVSYAGRYLEPARPGTWLDPGPYGCLGTGMGYAMGARIVSALGGAGETVARPAELGPALGRAFASGVPYLVNVLTDPADVDPRSAILA